MLIEFAVIVSPTLGYLFTFKNMSILIGSLVRAVSVLIRKSFTLTRVTRLTVKLSNGAKSALLCMIVPIGALGTRLMVCGVGCQVTSGT